MGLATMARYDTSAAARRMALALSRYGYSCHQIEHGLALRIETNIGPVILWLPEAYPAHEYLWSDKNRTEHRIPARMVRNLNAVAGRIAGTLSAPPKGRKYPAPRRTAPVAPVAVRPACEPDCERSDHDHDVYDQGGRRVPHVQPMCGRCLKPAHYDLGDNQYKHDDPATPGCADSPMLRVCPRRRWE